MEKVMKYGYVFLLGIFLIVGILICFAIKQGDSKLTPVEIKNNEAIIMNNAYGVDDIVKVELLDKVSLSGGSGFNSENTNNGRYKVNGDNFKSRVCIHKNVSPFIRLTTKNSVIVFNEDNSDTTKEIFNQLTELKQSQWSSIGRKT